MSKLAVFAAILAAGLALGQAAEGANVVHAVSTFDGGYCYMHANATSKTVNFVVRCARGAVRPVKSPKPVVANVATCRRRPAN